MRRRMQWQRDLKHAIQRRRSGSKESDMQEPITFNWKLEPQESLAVDAIVRRVAKVYRGQYGMRLDRGALRMDLVVCHNHACRLQLQQLAEAEQHDLLHDVGGINKHLDRRTGQLRDCFLPRYAAEEVQEEQRS